MADTAVIYTYSVIQSATEAFKDKVPYLAAIVTKPDGMRVAALVEGYRPDRPVGIGDTVAFAGNDSLGKATYKMIT